MPLHIANVSLRMRSSLNFSDPSHAVKMAIFNIIIVTMALLLCSSAQQTSTCTGNLVSNGGFETDQNTAGCVRATLVRQLKALHILVLDRLSLHALRLNRILLVILCDDLVENATRVWCVKNVGRAIPCLIIIHTQ